MPPDEQTAILLTTDELAPQISVIAVVGNASAATRLLARRWLPELAPYVLGGTAVLAGLILLLATTGPAETSRIAWLQDWLPPVVTSLSEFLIEAAGGGLIVLGWALTRRLDAAHRLTQFVLSAALLASLSRGFEWGEVVTLTMAFGLSLPARHVFNRRAAIGTEPMTPVWVVAALVLVATTGWLGVDSGTLAFRWAPGLGVALVVVSLARMLRFAPVNPDYPTGNDLARAAAISQAGRRGDANLALLGDKSLRFSTSGLGYLMFGVQGRSWIVMGDPVGAPDESRELAWSFRAEADRHGGRTVFYQVGGENLSLYIELGLALHKLGEEAIVPLEEFSLQGGTRRRLRQVQRGALKSGAHFSVVPRGDVPALLPEMRTVSDQWLEAKCQREKGFSLGRFDEEYLQHFPIATVRVGDRLVAFANLWAAPAGGELAIDIMRYAFDAPRDAMTFLFVELMLWGRTQGYTTFNLGMAPLAGLENRALAPLWNRVGALVFHHGQHFYNFAGLREYKNRFDPVWRPRYLASPAGLALPSVVANLITLVSGRAHDPRQRSALR